MSLDRDGVGRDQAPTAVLVRGPEELLAERAVSATLRGLRETAPELEVIRLSAARYQPDELATHTGPSLFGGDKAVVVERLDEASDELLDDFLMTTCRCPRTTSPSSRTPAPSAASGRSTPSSR